jgi:hypothetical protein
MAKSQKVKLTAEQGQLLLMMAVNFQPPEKIGDATYSPVERAQAREEVRLLFRDFKAISPHVQALGKKQRLLFGPADGWEEVRNDKGEIIQFEVRDTSREIEVRLSEDSVSGLLWCLATFMDSGSPAPVSVMVAENVIWPLVEKLGKVRALQEALGLDKGQPRRWKDDPEKDEERVPEEKTGNGHPVTLGQVRQ